MTMIPALLLDDTTGLLAMSGVFTFVMLAVMIVVLVGMWKVFEKAGQPGWAALVPLYNGYIILKIAGRPGWWLLLFFIPLVNIVLGVVVAIDIAKAFGQSAVFGVVLLVLLAGVGYLVLGFGNYRYVGPARAV